MTEKRERRSFACAFFRQLAVSEFARRRQFMLAISWVSSVLFGSPLQQEEVMELSLLPRVAVINNHAGDASHADLFFGDVWNVCKSL